MKRMTTLANDALLLADASLRYFLALLILALGVALAQSPVILTPDLPGGALGFLNGLATSPLALGLAVFGFVATIKRDAERRSPPILWNPWLWRGVAGGIGLALALLLHAMTGLAALLYPGWTGAVMFGLVAGVVAVIGRDGLKTVTGWIGEWGDHSPPAAAQHEGPPASAFEQATQVRGLLGVGSLGADLPPAMLATLRSLLAAHLPQNLPGDAALDLALRLTPILPDLALDGSPYLSEPSRQRVLDVIMDVRSELGL